MVCPEGAQDEVVYGGVWLVPGVVETIVLCLEMNKSIWLNPNPLPRESKREREKGGVKDKTL